MIKKYAETQGSQTINSNIYKQNEQNNEEYSGFFIEEEDENEDMFQNSRESILSSNQNSALTKLLVESIEINKKLGERIFHLEKKTNILVQQSIGKKLQGKANLLLYSWVNKPELDEKDWKKFYISKFRGEKQWKVFNLEEKKKASSSKPYYQFNIFLKKIIFLRIVQ